MIGYWAVKSFLVSKITGITSFSTKAPAGLHEDEVPNNADPTKIAVVYQLEAERSLLGNGAAHVWDEVSALVDVIVPGKSQTPGRTLMKDIYTALHGATGTNAEGSVSSCVFRGVVPTPPEHDATSGADFEHLRQRFELHARGV